MIVARGGRYGVRITVDGKQTWLGTYATRDEAVQVEQADLRRLRANRKQRMRRRNMRDQAAKRSGDHWLYYCYSACDELLYVGITSGGVQRFRQHGNDKLWWPQVATIRVEHFDTRAEVEAAERAALIALRPPHNTRGVPSNVVAFPGGKEPA